MNTDLSSEDDAPSGLVMWIGGVPRPQPRPRFVGRGVVSTTGKAKRWRDQVRAVGRDAVANAGGPEAVKDMLGDRVRVKMRFVLSPRSRADADNLAKLVLDALMDAGALGGDDRRVTTLEVEKVVGGWQGCQVEIRPDAPTGVAKPGAGLAGPGWLVGGEGREPDAL